MSLPSITDETEISNKKNPVPFLTRRKNGKTFTSSSHNTQMSDRIFSL
jgi:hypothetical protein